MRKAISFLFLILVGCQTGTVGSSWFTDKAIEHGMKDGSIMIGKSKSQVSSVIRPTYSGCIKRKITQQGTVELWDFATKLCGANSRNRYALVFRDDTLVEIREVRSIQDLSLDNVSFPPPTAPTTPTIDPQSPPNVDCELGLVLKNNPLKGKWECTKECESGYVSAYNTLTKKWDCVAK